MSAKYEHMLTEVPAALDGLKVQQHMQVLEEQGYELVAVAVIPWSRPPMTRHYWRKERTLILQAPNSRDFQAQLDAQ